LLSSIPEQYLQLAVSAINHILVLSLGNAVKISTSWMSSHLNPSLQYYLVTLLNKEYTDFSHFGLQFVKLDDLGFSCPRLIGRESSGLSVLFLFVFVSL
jgi:hypothetical protein